MWQMNVRNVDILPHKDIRIVHSHKRVVREVSQVNRVMQMGETPPIEVCHCIQVVDPLGLGVTLSKAKSWYEGDKEEEWDFHSGGYIGRNCR
jgi:hypothetical protein